MVSSLAAGGGTLAPPPSSMRSIDEEAPSATVPSGVGVAVPEAVIGSEGVFVSTGVGFATGEAIVGASKPSLPELASTVEAV